MPCPWSARDRVNGGVGPALRCPKEIYYRCARSAGYAPQARMLSCEIEGPRCSSTSALTRYRLRPGALTRYIGPSHLLLPRVTVWAPVVAVDLNQGVRHVIPVHFPALQKPYASIQRRAGRTVRVTAKRDVVAIVDDDDGVRESLRFLLEAAG